MAYEANHWVPDEIITTPKMNNIEDGLLEVSERALYGHGGADQASEGIHSLVYVDKGNPMPSNPTVGDTVFVRDGSDFVLMEWNGEEWVPRIDPDLTNRLQENIDKANEATQAAIETNNISINETIEQVAKEQADLAIKDGDFVNKAQVMADKALSDAKADSTIKADKALSDAKAALNTAKTDLNSSIQKEITDRTNSVTALDTKAQGYVSQAKSDAIAAAKDADGIISKKIDDTASSLSLTIDQNEQDAEGKISTVSANATLALDQIKTKVSQNDYDKKTGDLTTQLNTTTQTATQSKTDIVDIKAKDNSQDSRMLSIENDATGTKTTVSDLKKTSDTQSGNISTLQQRADRFDATVTKVDNLAVGGRNYLISGTAALGWLGDNSIIGHNGAQSVVYDYISTTAKEVWSYSVWSDKQYTVTSEGKYLRYALYDSNKQQIMRKAVGLNISTDTAKGQIVVDDNSAVAYMRVSIDWVANGYGHAKFEKGNIPTDWSPAPEDVDSASAKAQLTADQATTSLSAYKTDADGRISKAQSDIVQTAKDVTTKVSQSDYNAKTGDLSASVSKAQQTADSVVTTIGNYKTSNDNRVSSAETKISQNSNDISLRATKTDLDTAKTDYTAKISQINVNYDGINQTVSELNGKVNDLSQINLVSNSEFSPDLSGWFVRGDPMHISAPDSSSSGYNKSGHVVLDSTGKSGGDVYYTSSPSPIGTSRQSFAETVQIRSNTENALLYLGAVFYDVNKNAISGSRKGVSVGGNWLLYINNGVIPSNAKYISFDILIPASVQSRFVISQPMLVAADNVGSYVQGGYVNNDKIASQQITIDGITNVISNPTTGLSVRVQTAEGTLSTVKGTDIPALQNATFWQPYSSLNFNDYTKQGSFFFNTTAAKTNGPTTSSAWMYLMVEQGTSAKDRIKQTAWYDGVTGVKITYVRTLNSGTWSPWYANDNDSVTTISQTNSDVKQEIENRKTGDSNTLQSSKDFTTSNISSAVSGINSTITQTANGILGNIGATNLFGNSEFTQDYGWRSKNGTVSYLANQNVDGQYHGVVRVISTAASHQGYWLRNIPVRGGAKYSGSVRVHFTNNNLSSGLALYDLWFVNKDGTRINGGTGGGGKRSTSAVTSPYWIDLYIDGVTAPTDAVYAQVSLLVNNAGAGMVADFTMPTFTATDVHQPYTPNDDIAFQLGLFKDNWSIGLTDNMSKIVSGIVADTNSMSVISDKVIIKSPNTQITGTAWITSAMIGDAQIKAANIADAAIGSAKISSLDVAKLSGNVSAFLQTNWNGSYGAASMSADGMIIATGSSVSTFNANGMIVWSPDGVTAMNNGTTTLYANNEDVGIIGRTKDSIFSNVDYLTLGLHGWHTTTPGDDKYDSNATKSNDPYGGDGIAFAVTTGKDTFANKMTWDSSLVAGYKGRKMGWHVEDIFTTHQPMYIENGLTVQGSYSNGIRSLHAQGMDISTGARWFGFMDGPNKTGFGTDQTQDVIFYVKGKNYSLYTMLNKLGML